MLIKHGTIIDGTGKDKFNADIRIENDRITEIKEDIKPRNNEDILDAKNKYVVPGFVDILNHSDAYATLFENPAQESLLQQGITTVLMGNCGSSLAPLVDGTFVNSIRKWGDVSKINVNWQTVEEYLKELESHSFGLNLATLMGHSTIRRGLIDSEPRALKEPELRQMEYLMEEGLKQGAFGISTGLAYSHARETNKQELERIMSVAKKHDALYSTHIRNEGEGFAESIVEQLNIAKKTGVNLEFSHLKVSGDKKYWDQYEKGLAQLEEIDSANFDIYPYAKTASVLYTFLPEWASKGGNDTIFKVLENKEQRQKLTEEMKNDANDYGSMVVAMGDVGSSYFGKTLKEVAKNQDTDAEAIALNLIEASNNRVIVFTESISEESIKKGMQHPKSFVSSDGAGYNKQFAGKGEVAHPRYFGAMPRFLGKYIRDEKLLSWEEGIRKITQGPAEKIGIKDRGKIQKDHYADIVVFDPGTINDQAGTEDPYKYPLGIDYVLVNGKIAVEKRELKDLNGKILKK